MVSRIAVLEKAVIAQIAAGEVVERPASVVKELVENAVDAGASRVEVALDAAGQQRICVIDDGCGMTADEARIAVQRHATSKLRAVNDLNAISTLGFRGEGLWSVAAISRLRVRTRSASDTLGTEIFVEGGVLREVMPVGCAAGTSVEVADLFFNTPVRARFLKSDATETGHVADTIMRIGGAHAHVRFLLKIDGRTVVDLPRRQTFFERADDILGSTTGDVALFNATHEESGITVQICMKSPDVNSGAARSLMTLVNRRFVRERMLLHAVQAGLGECAETGRYPLGVVSVELDSSAVDVNVHPQKTEVRFQSADVVHEAVKNAVQCAMRDYGACVDAPRRKVYQVRSSDAERFVFAADTAPSADEAAQRFWSAQRNDDSDFGLAEALGRIEAKETNEPRVTGGSDANVRVLGRTASGWVVCEAAEQLLVIDAQAFFRRQIAEALRQDISSEKPGIPLPRGVQVVFDQPQIRVLTANSDALSSLGFELEPFGGASWLLRSVPAQMARVLRISAEDSGVGDRFVELLDRLSDVKRIDAIPTAIQFLAEQISCNYGTLDDQAFATYVMQQIESGRVEPKIVAPLGATVQQSVSCAPDLMALPLRKSATTDAT